MNIMAPRPFEISNFYFILNDGEKTSFLFLPNDDFYYEVNEIPPEYAATLSLRVVAAKWLYKLDSFYLPEYNYNINRLQRFVDMNYSADTGYSEISGKILLNGTFSTELRRHFEKVIFEGEQPEILNTYQTLSNDAFSLDTIFISKVNRNEPFNFDIAYRGRIDNKYSKTLKDSTIIIPLHDFLIHYIQPSNEEERLFDYYSPFRYYDGYIYQITFPGDVKILNRESLLITEDNPFGSYNISVYSSGNLLSVKSEYIIKASKLPREGYFYLKDINNAYESAKNSSLIIRMKP